MPGGNLCSVFQKEILRKLSQKQEKQAQMEHTVSTSQTLTVRCSYGDFQAFLIKGLVKGTGRRHAVRRP